jgi:hypothetical protein
MTRRTVSSSAIKAGYEQEEQFEDEQPEQPEPAPPFEGSFNLPPVENPKVDIFFLGLLLPH